MGRRRRKQYFVDGELKRYRADTTQADKVKTPQDFVSFFSKSRGPVQKALFQSGLLYFDAQGNVRLAKAKVTSEVASLRGRITGTREYSRDYIEQLAGEQGAAQGLTAAQVMKAEERALKARAQAVRMAARVGNVELTAADKRALTQIENGLYKAAYGKLGQYEGGTLASKFRGSGKAKSTDASARARAEENRERLNEYRGQRYKVDNKKGVQQPTEASPPKASASAREQIEQIKRQEADFKRFQEARAQAAEQRRKVSNYAPPPLPTNAAAVSF